MFDTLTTTPITETRFKAIRPVWERVGFTVEEPIYDPVEALILAGANWRVYKTPMTCVKFDPETQAASTFNDTRLFGVFRETDNEYFGHIGKDFTLVQNIVGFDWFKPLLEERVAYIESAGTLKSGAIVWIMARLHEQNQKLIIGGDTVEQRVLLTLCHNTDRAPQLTFVNTRTSCQSVLGQNSGAYRRRHASFKMRQTKGIGQKMLNLSKEIGVGAKCFDLDVQAYQALAAKGINNAYVRTYLQQLFAEPLSATRTLADGTIELKHTIDSYKPTVAIQNALANNEDLQLAGVRGTAWALYLAVCYYQTYVAGDRKRPKTGTKMEAQLEDLWFVDDKSLLQTSLDLLL